MATPYLSLPKNLRPKRAAVPATYPLGTTDFGGYEPPTETLVPVEVALMTPLVNFGAIGLLGLYDATAIIGLTSAWLAAKLVSKSPEQSWILASNLLMKPAHLQLLSLRVPGDEAALATMIGSLSHRLVNFIAVVARLTSWGVGAFFVGALLFAQLGHELSPPQENSIWAPQIVKVWTFASTFSLLQFLVAASAVALAGIAFGWSYSESMVGVQCVSSTSPPLDRTLFATQEVLTPVAGISRHSVPAHPQSPERIAIWLAARAEAPPDASQCIDHL